MFINLKSLTISGQQGNKYQISLKNFSVKFERFMKQVIMKKFLLIIALLFTQNCSVNSANILGIFPTPSISHQVVFQALMKDLAARGHHLTILTPDLIKINNPNVTQIDLHESYKIFRSQVNFVNQKVDMADEGNLMKVFNIVMTACLNQQLTNSEVKKLIDKVDGKTFDLVIFEYQHYVPVLAFAEIYDCPAIGIISLDAFASVHEEFGNGANPVIHPSQRN